MKMTLSMNMICVYLYVLYMLYTCVFIFCVIFGLGHAASVLSNSVTHCNYVEPAFSKLRTSKKFSFSRNIVVTCYRLRSTKVYAQVCAFRIWDGCSEDYPQSMPGVCTTTVTADLMLAILGLL